MAYGAAAGIKEGAVAGGIAYGISKAASFGISALKAAAPFAGGALMAYGAYKGYQANGLGGAAKGALGLDPGKASEQSKFETANTAYKGMQAAAHSTPADKLRGWANPDIQRAAQEARKRSGHA